MCYHGFGKARANYIFGIVGAVFLPVMLCNPVVKSVSVLQLVCWQQYAGLTKPSVRRCQLWCSAVLQNGPAVAFCSLAGGGVMSLEVFQGTQGGLL
jgi:hypothetical protein